MKREIQRHPDSNNGGGANNEGADLTGLGIGDDSNLNNKTTKIPDTTTTTTETPEAKLARESAEGLTKEKAISDLAIATKFGGIKLDDKGNALDATGKIVKTAEEIKASNETPTGVTIDDVDYKLDDKGNAVDKDGKIFKTKAELDSLESADEIPVTQEILQKSGLTILGEDGKPKTYEDTPEGLLTLSNDIANEKSKAIIKDYFTKRPDLQDFAKHLDRGGNKEDYFKQQQSSWRNVKLDEKNESQLISATVTDLMRTGMTKEQAEETAKLYKDTDKLKEFGKAAYTRLVNADKASDEAKERAYNEQVANETLQLENHWKSVDAVVKKGVLNNITIPETERQAFFEFIAFTADEHGNSKSTIERTKLPIELQLQLDYLVFKKFDLSKLITSAVKTSQANTLRNRFKTQGAMSGGEGADKSKMTKPNANADNISIDTLY